MILILFEIILLYLVVWWTHLYIYGPSEIVTELGKIRFTLEFLGGNRNSETLGKQYFVMQELESYRYPWRDNFATLNTSVFSH